MRRQVTAFGSAGVFLAERCRLSAVLADDPEPEMAPWLWWGIFIHRFLEYSKTIGRDKALEYIALEQRRRGGAAPDGGRGHPDKPRRAAAARRPQGWRAAAPILSVGKE